VVEKPSPLKNDGQLVTWDDEIPNIWKVIKFMFQTTNQAKMRILYRSLGKLFHDIFESN